MRHIGVPSLMPLGLPHWKNCAQNIINGNIILSQDFKEFLELLNVNQVRYLVVDGYAVAIHGHPRYTKDIDIWIESTPENAEKLVLALDQFGFASLGLKESDFREPDTIIQLGYPPNRIDLLTSLLGVEISECYAEKN